MQAYSNPDREADEHALPDLEIFQMTAREIVENDEDLIFEYMKRREFRLASMSSRDRDAMFDAMIDEEKIEGGWFYWYCFPGCMPDGGAIGPFLTADEAKTAAQEEAEQF